MAGKESTTTQPGDSLNDQFERRLAAGRAALRRSEEARAESTEEQNKHGEFLTQFYKDLEERRIQSRKFRADVHKVWMSVFSRLEAGATEAPVVGNPPPRIPPAGKPRDKGIEARDHLIATLKESCKSLKGIRRNKRIAQSLDENGERPPESWGVRTFVEATENRKASRAFDRMVAKAQYKKIPTK
jgi:hypothetical protein